MRELNEMTAVELVNNMNEVQLFLDDIPHSRLHRTQLQLVQDELDARCELAGIKTNPDGTFFIPEFTGTVDEMLDYISLLNYFTHKQ
jgi:hypothetical protein